jgi:lysophospholipase L1-like esterase
MLSREQHLSLKVAGFGACMISGYPHNGGGFLEIACDQIGKSLSRPVQSTIVSLGGFPAPRAAKHLKSKVFGFNPDYVVIQFGTTDTQCPIRKKRPKDNRSNPLPRDSGLKPNQDAGVSFHSRPAKAKSRLRWELISLLADLQKVEPITSLTSFIAAIESMVEDCRSAEITPVVLSPFVCGSRHTMRYAISYTNALHELLRDEDVIVVDCIQPLRGFSKSWMLQHDGVHLSRAGHNIIGEAIARAIVTDASHRLRHPQATPELV